MNFAANNIYKYTSLLTFDKAVITLTTDEGVKGKQSKINRKVKPLSSMNLSILFNLSCFSIYLWAVSLKKCLTVRKTKYEPKTVAE